MVARLALVFLLFNVCVLVRKKAIKCGFLYTEVVCSIAAAGPSIDSIAETLALYSLSE